MDIKIFLYDGIRNFVLQLKPTEKNWEQYRDLMVYHQQFKEAAKTVTKNKEPTKEIYNADIFFKSFVANKIEIICSVCNHNQLFSLSDKEIADWFFSKNVSLVAP